MYTLQSYAAAVAVGGLPFILQEEARAFPVLAHAAASTEADVLALLALLCPPAEAHELAPLPLPPPPPPAPPAPATDLTHFAARQPTLLATLAPARAPPPCASSAPPLPLAHPLRALRGAALPGGGAEEDPSHPALPTVPGLA